MLGTGCRYFCKVAGNLFKSSRDVSHTSLPRHNKIKNRTDVRLRFLLCPGEDLNLHGLLHTHLKRAWLPVTAPGQYFLCSRFGNYA